MNDNSGNSVRSKPGDYFNTTSMQRITMIA